MVHEFLHKKVMVNDRRHPLKAVNSRRQPWCRRKIRVLRITLAEHIFHILPVLLFLQLWSPANITDIINIFIGHFMTSFVLANLHLLCWQYTSCIWSVLALSPVELSTTTCVCIHHSTSCYIKLWGTFGRGRFSMVTGVLVIITQAIILVLSLRPCEIFMCWLDSPCLYSFSYCLHKTQDGTSLYLYNDDRW